MNKVILPFVGFDKVKFGMSQEQVIEILGNPDEIEADQNFSDNACETEELTTIFTYFELGVSLSFEKCENYRLMEISFDDNDFKLGDMAAGVSKEMAFKAAEKLGFEEPYEDDLSEYGEEVPEGFESYTYDDKNVTLYFEDGILATIQIGPEWLDNDIINWPK